MCTLVCVKGLRAATTAETVMTLAACLTDEQLKLVKSDMSEIGKNRAHVIAFLVCIIESIRSGRYADAEERQSRIINPLRNLRGRVMFTAEWTNPEKDWKRRFII